MDIETPVPPVDSSSLHTPAPGAAPRADDDDGGTLDDHAAQFGRRSPQPARPADAPTAPPANDRAAAAPVRDASGKFVKGEEPKAEEKPKAERHRAAKQEASPEDVPRIRELTRQLRETQERLRAYETPKAPVTEAPKAEAAPVKPDPEKFTYGTADPAYVEALADWKVAQAVAQLKAEREAERTAEARSAAETQLRTSWQSRVADARKAYDDFDDIALNSETRIPQGSLVDAWILEHPKGAHVLYHLHAHPDELDELQGLPPMEQVEALALLSQRLAPTPRAAAEKTGAAPSRSVTPAPRPPTPVRTGPTRAAETPDDETSTLADHEAAYYPTRRRA